MPEQSPTKLLQGKRILVTRSREQAGALSQRLAALGAIPIEFPTIRIVPPLDWALLDAALKRLFIAGSEPYYTWLVFTSANGVRITFERLRHLGYAASDIKYARLAAIGPATASALHEYGLTVDLVPDTYIAEGIAAALIADARRRGESLHDQRILLARAAGARHVLVFQLLEAGAIVDEVIAYRAVPVSPGDQQAHDFLHLLQTGQLDILTFTSPSTVRNFVQWLTENTIATQNLKAIVACIGPITAQAARDLGLKVDIEARTFTIEGLIEAIIQHY